MTAEKKTARLGKLELERVILTAKLTLVNAKITTLETIVTEG